MEHVGFCGNASMNIQPVREGFATPKLFKSFAVPESRPHCQRCGRPLRRSTNDDGSDARDIGYVRLLPNGRSIRICTEHEVN